MSLHRSLGPWALSLAVAGPSALAHHSISRVYDSANQVTIEGVVAEFRFVNPHPFLVIEVTTDRGVAELWQLEMDNRFELTRIGITDETFAPGDQVRASGSAGRSKAQTLYLRRLLRPADGLLYEQIGSSPRLGRDDR